MKKDIHPKYKTTIFKDISTDDLFLTKSTINTNKTMKYTDGKVYPLVEMEITSASHPYYTGAQKLVDTAGRIERFRKKFNLKS